MSENKKLIPKRRFKAFQNTDAWKQRELGEVAIINPQATLPDVFEYVDLESVVGTEMISYRTEEKSTAPSRAQRLAKQGDIFYQTVRPYQKNNYLFDKSDNDFVFSTGYAQLRPNINSDFLMSYIQDERFVLTVLSNCTGTSYPAISPSSLSKIMINVPKSTDEQEKVGTFFTTLDQTIAFQQRKLEKMKSMKSAYLSEMFPAEGERKPKRRFPGFTDDWEQRELGEEVEFFSGLTYSPSNVVMENGTLVLRSSNVKNGEIVKGDNVFVNDGAVNSENVKVGDIIVVVRNGSRNLIGKHAQVKEDMDKTVIGAFMTGVRAEQSSFINALLDTKRFEFEIAQNLGATINQITTGSFKKMRFMFPKNDEQNQIGQFFTHLDQTIAFQQQKLEKLQNIKKAYLNEMFI